MYIFTEVIPYHSVWVQKQTKYKLKYYIGHKMLPMTSHTMEHCYLLGITLKVF